MRPLLPSGRHLLHEKKAEIRYPEECWMCGSCRQECPSGAITLRFPLNTLYNASSNPYM